MASDDTRKTRILIVDDDPDWREFLSVCLDDLGFEGVEAQDGEQALELLRRERFPVVLLDVKLPGIDGLEVLRNLPSPAPRVILLTSSGAEELGDALSADPCYYLPKDATAGSLSLILDSMQL